MFFADKSAGDSRGCRLAVKIIPLKATQNQLIAKRVRNVRKQQLIKGSNQCDCIYLSIVYSTEHLAPCRRASEPHNYCLRRSEGTQPHHGGMLRHPPMVNNEHTFRPPVFPYEIRGNGHFHKCELIVNIQTHGNALLENSRLSFRVI